MKNKLIQINNVFPRNFTQHIGLFGSNWHRCFRYCAGNPFSKGYKIKEIMVNEKFNPEKSLEEVDPFNSEGLTPDPHKLIRNETIDIDVLKKLVGQSVISVDQFDKQMVLELCKFAALLESTEIASSHHWMAKLLLRLFLKPAPGHAFRLKVLC